MASHTLTLNSPVAIGYPEGQSVSLYPVSNWPTPDKQRDPSGATPVGASTASASVTSGIVSFGSVPDGDYWLYASVGGNRIYRLTHVGGPDPAVANVDQATLLAHTPGVWVDDQAGANDDAMIDAAITAATAAGDGTFVVFAPRVYSIASLHVFDRVAPVGQGASTVIRATNAAAGIRTGTALGTASRNVNLVVRCGDFAFDANNLSTVGVQTNTVNWRYAGITIYGLPSGTHALNIWGQNNEYDVWAVSTGTGFCIAFDNGAGGNRISGKLNGTNFVLFDESVDTGSGYRVPTENILDGVVTDQPGVVGTYGILHRAGQHNVIRDCNILHQAAAAIIKFERGAYAGGGYQNSYLNLEGRNLLTGSGAAGQFVVWADFVSGGVAGQAGPAANSLLDVRGEVNVGSIADGDFKWGATNPCQSSGVFWERKGSVRPFWTPDGTGAKTGPVGIWHTDVKTGVDGLPTTALEINRDVMRTFGSPVYANSPVVQAAAAAPGTSVGRFARCIAYRTGTISSLAYYVSASSGNVKFLIYDVGQASSGNYTKLYASGSVAVAALDTWQTINPALAVTRGQEFIAGVVFDNVTATYGRGPAPGNAASASLPSGYGTATGLSAVRAALTGTVTFAAIPDPIADATLAGTAVPLMILFQIT